MTMIVGEVQPWGSPLKHPLLDLRLVPLDSVGGLRFDRVAVGHLDRGRQHVSQGQRPVLGQHRQQPAASRDGSEELVLAKRTPFVAGFLQCAHHLCERDEKAFDVDCS